MLRLIVTGDSFITRRMADTPERRALSALIGAADARFTNFESLTPGEAGIPAAVSGGTWASAPAGVIDDLKAMGFNLFAWANNHTLDFSHAGLAATTAAMDAAGVVHAGVGRNLAEAGAPRYLETQAGRVALVAVTSTFHESAAAGQQRPDSPGRPGVNPLRFTTTYTLPRPQLAALAEMAASCGINAAREASVKAGFAEPAPEGVVLFGGHRFREGEAAGCTTEPHAGDMARIAAAIGLARRQADHVLLSLHAHEMAGGDKAIPAEFLRVFSRSCIEAGADVVIGHGPHVLRGVEFHQGRPIFHSLGNFIFQNETIPVLPADFYEKYGLGLTENVADAIDRRSDGNRRGFAADPWAWRSVVARLVLGQGGPVSVEVVPVELGHGLHRARRGTPRLSGDPAILDHLAELCQPYGTRVVAEDGIGRVLPG